MISRSSGRFCSAVKIAACHLPGRSSKLSASSSASWNSRFGRVDYSLVEESADQAATETNSNVALGGSGCGFSATKLIVALGGSG
jgi:hypothetical protein